MAAGRRAWRSTSIASPTFPWWALRRAVAASAGPDARRSLRRCERGEGSTLVEERLRGGPVEPVHGEAGTVAEQARGERGVPVRMGAGDGEAEGRVGAGEVTQRRPRERDGPQREVAPAAPGTIEDDGTQRVGQRILRSLPAHRGPQQRAAHLERGRAVGRRSLERAAVRDPGEALHPRDIARLQLLPRPVDRQPRSCCELVVGESLEPRPCRRAMRAPLRRDQRPAHHRCREIEIAGRERVGDRFVDRAPRLQPDGRPPVPLRDAVGLMGGQLRPEVVSQHRVEAVPAVPLVFQEGSAREAHEGSRRGTAIEDGVARGPAEALEDRAAEQQLGVGVGQRRDDLRAQVVHDRRRWQRRGRATVILQSRRVGGGEGEQRGPSAHPLDEQADGLRRDSRTHDA